jgi:hypothetical protein
MDFSALERVDEPTRLFDKRPRARMRRDVTSVNESRSTKWPSIF